MKARRKFISLLLTAAMVFALGPVFTQTAWAEDNVSYIDASGAQAYQSNVTEITDGTIPTLEEGGWYIVKGAFTRSGLTVDATGEGAHLILEDDCDLTVNGGIDVTGSNKLTIYAQSTGESTGKLTATGGYGGAGIGGGYEGAGGALDITNEEYYAKAVTWAAGEGIVEGYGDAIFRPDIDITRQEFAAVLLRLANHKGLTLPAVREYDAFEDDANISDYARTAVETLYKAGIISGKPSNMFDPKGTATRAEAATILHRFLESARK
jgi:hypothetical protein